MANEVDRPAYSGYGRPARGLVWPGLNPSDVPIPALLRGSWRQSGGAGSHVIKTRAQHQRAAPRRDPKSKRRSGHGKERGTGRSRPIILFWLPLSGDNPPSPHGRPSGPQERFHPRLYSALRSLGGHAGRNASFAGKLACCKQGSRACTRQASAGACSNSTSGSKMPTAA